MSCDKFENKTAGEVIRWAFEKFGERVAIASSFGAEDVVLIDLAARLTENPRIFTLDTGRLPEETYALVERIRDRYSLSLELFFPERSEVEKITEKYGPNLFYKSVELRKLCCQIRKVEPLKRTLAGLEAWICGLRKEQSVTRVDIKKVQDDGGIVKINPLADWSTEEIWDYIKRNDLPYNTLHDKGYPSIGCAPCTRPVQPGEDIRAGRWWWESPEHKECGLHGRG